MDPQEVAGSESSSPSEPAPEHVRAASEPVVPALAVDMPPEGARQISAPSILVSQSVGPSPFRKPLKEPRPRLIKGFIMTEQEAIEMVAATEADPKNGLRRYVDQLLTKKNLSDVSNRTERRFIVSLVKEAVSYGAQHDFNARKLSFLITLYLVTHQYFKFYYWTGVHDVWKYFKELLVRHTIENSPDGEEVFEPEESYDILTHFHTTYLSNLPLIHILTFGVFRIKLEWPFN